MNLLQKENEVIEKNSKNIMPMIMAMNKVDPEKHKIPDSLKGVAESLADNVIVEFNDKDDPSKGFSISFKGQPAFQLDKALKEISLHKGQISMLYQSSLISLIVFFELLVSRVIHTHITRFPDIIGAEDKTLSLDEIRKIGSFEEAEQFLIDQEVEGIMYGSFEKWYKYLIDKIKLSVTYVEKNKDILVEIFQRRNLLVHNG